MKQKSEILFAINLLTDEPLLGISVINRTINGVDLKSKEEFTAYSYGIKIGLFFVTIIIGGIKFLD